jgi:CubicO group peptidase (beta-lactamase class C family)
MVVGIVTAEKDEVFTFGKCKDKAPDRNSVYEIGSVTKVFTGLLLADRVQQKIVRIDDPVQKHLPEGWTVPRRDDRDITLLQLATHTSSLPRTPNGFVLAALKDPVNPFGKFDVEVLKKWLPETQLKYPIGSHQEYSNLGAGLLGHALAFASKAKNYEEVLVQRILNPLELNDTRLTLNGSQTARLIPGFDESGTPRPNWNFPCLEACGGLRSTASDMMKFVKVNLKPTGSMKDVLEMARQPWREVQPGEEESGLFWVRYLKKKEPPKIWHNGQTGGYHSFVGFIPEKGGVVVLFNVATMKLDDIGFDVLAKLAEGK